MMNSLVHAIIFAGSALAATNDWSVPCHSGSCAWDMPASSDGSSGSLQIWGTSHALADITPAAGWTILNCDATANSQTIRVACTSDASGCSHLLQANATGRVVRLTDDCGTAPFARIADMSVADDQSVPVNLLRRRSAPTVYELTFDTDFSAGGSEHGPVNFAVTASSLPNVNTSPSDIVPARRSGYMRRSDELEMKRSYVASGVQELTMRDGNSFNLTNTTTLEPVNINQSGNVFNTTISCKSASVPFDASVSADVDAVANAQITLGVVAAGTLIPPSLDTAAITAGLSGNISSVLKVNASADGTFSSPSITILDLPLPGGLVIPGVISLGPTFKVLAKATANLGVGIDMAVGLTYSVENASLVFPPSQGPSGGNFSPLDTPLQISTDTNVTGDVSLTGHLIPELVIGIDAFTGLAQTTVTLSLDASATLAMNGSAHVTDSSSSDGAVLVADGACVDMSTGLAVTAAADVGLFNIFDKGTSVSLFSKTFDLFSTCKPQDIAGLNDTSSSSDSGDSSDDSPSPGGSLSASNSTSSTNSSSSYDSSSLNDCYAKCSSMYGLTPPSMGSGSPGTNSGYGMSNNESQSMGDTADAMPTAAPNTYMAIAMSALPTPRAVYAPAPRAVHQLAKRVDLTCPSLPFNIHLPPNPSKVTPTPAKDGA